MALDILKRLGNYIFPLSLLAIGLYGKCPRPVCSLRIYVLNRRFPCSARDRDLPETARGCLRRPQLERPCLWKIVA